MDGFCVGEPWNARAIADGIGFTAITTQQMWKDHPEKVCAFTEEFATKNPKTVKAVMRAVLEASQWIDKLENRPRMAEVVAQPQYINTIQGDHPRPHARRLRLRRRPQGEGQVLHDLLRPPDQLPAEVARRLVAQPVPALGHGRRRRPTTRASSTACTAPTSIREVAKEMGVETPRRGHEEGDALRRRHLRSRRARRSTPRASPITLDGRARTLMTTDPRVAPRPAAGRASPPC